MTFFKYFSILVLLLVGLSAAHAAGPVETSPYAVQGIDVDETDTSAKAAKDKALIDVQLKALTDLGRALGGEDVATELAKLDAKQVLPMLKSLSIEQEVISPGRYQAKFTVRFLPDRIKPLFARLGVKLPAEQGPPMLVIPVWTADGKTIVWDDNPWRKAWLDLNATQAQIPLIIPLGDQEDASTLSPQDVADNNVVKLEAIRRRYDVKTMLVAYAEPVEGGGIHAKMIGTSPIGKMTFDKIYTADSGTVNDSASLGAQRIHQVMLEKFKSDVAKIVAAKAAAAGPLSIPVTIPFNGPSEWNGLRGRILSTPGVLGVDVTSLDGQGAAAQLKYSGTVEDVANSLQASGLRLTRDGGSWVISAL
jgi:Uncharacterized protein conserved in bacteria (DUF2066)